MEFGIAFAWLSGEDELRMFRMDYSDSSPYANAYLKKVNTATDEFWEAFVVTFDSCDYLEALIAAADELDGQTILDLLEGLNENEMWGRKLKALHFIVILTRRNLRVLRRACVFWVIL